MQPVMPLPFASVIGEVVQLVSLKHASIMEELFPIACAAWLLWVGTFLRFSSLRLFARRLSSAEDTRLGERVEHGGFAEHS